VHTFLFQKDTLGKELSYVPYMASRVLDWDPDIVYPVPSGNLMHWYPLVQRKSSVRLYLIRFLRHFFVMGWDTSNTEVLFKGMSHVMPSLCFLKSFCYKIFLYYNDFDDFFINMEYSPINSIMLEKQINKFNFIYQPDEI